MQCPEDTYLTVSSPVSMKPLLRSPVVAGVVPVELPDDETLVTAGAEDHVRVLGVGGDLSDPAIVAPEGAPQLQGLSHCNTARPFFSETFHN